MYGDIERYGSICEVEHAGLPTHVEGSPRGAEPGDHYSLSPLGVVRFVTGQDLVTFLTADGVIWGKTPSSMHFVPTLRRGRYA